MRKKRTYFILILIIVVFFVFMFFTFGVENINQRKYSSTIIVGDTTVWKYKEQKWSNITAVSAIQKLNWQEYHVFVNNEKFGDYSLWYDDKWYLFDSQKNAVPYEGNLLAYSANYEIPVYPFVEKEIENMGPVEAILRDNNLSISSQFTSSSQISFDFDQDGIVEDFYLITNAFPIDFQPDTIFSLVFMVKNDIIYTIYNDVSVNRSFNGCKPFFTSFLDTNHDGIYEFILSCGRYSISEQLDMLYQYRDNEFKIVVSNQ